MYICRWLGGSSLEVKQSDRNFLLLTSIRSPLPLDTMLLKRKYSEVIFGYGVGVRSRGTESRHGIIFRPKIKEPPLETYADVRMKVDAEK